MKRRMLAGALGIALILSACGCAGATVQAADLMTGVKANPISAQVDLAGDESGAIAGFAVDLFQSSMVPEKNVLISPLCALYALAMTANGAQGNTLAQMEDVLGLSVAQLNDYLRAYMESLPSGDGYKISLADSIWFKEDAELAIEPDFLQTNADYYGASIYKAAFDDATRKAINAWVSENTEGMIEDILDQLPDTAVMYLINALAFDAQWADIYREEQVWAGTFTTQAGESRDVEMMYNTESRYLEHGGATGFLKYYADRKYAFAALLPGKGVSMADYVATLTGEGLMNTLNNAQDIQVKTAIPKFESEYSVEMSGILKSMGMTDAFDGGLADFTGIGRSRDNLFIGRVLHKTYIAVDEKGTRAGAATAVEMLRGSAPLEEFKTVYLNRPFVFMLIHCETNLPIFIGTVMDIGE